MLHGRYRIEEVVQINDVVMRQIGELRIRAWRTDVPEVGKYELWIDEQDWYSRHWVVEDDDGVVGSARLSVHDSIDELPDAAEYAGLLSNQFEGRIASLNRLVVDPRARGKGLSRLLDEMRMDAAEKSGCSVVVASTSSGEFRIKQLISLGFEVIGDRKRFPLIGLVPRPGKVLVCRLPREQGGVQ